MTLAEARQRNKEAEAFDPIAYVRDARAKPDDYVLMRELWEAIWSLRTAKDIATLKQAFTEHTRKHKGDKAALEAFTTIKDRRKEELEKA